MATRLQPPERRNETIQVMVTPREREQLERIAQREQISLSDAGRRAILKDLRGVTTIGDRGPGKA